MARWRWALLIFELFLFALILILPQVDLPDTAFRDGHTPVMAKRQVNSVPITCSAFAVLSAFVESERTVSAVPGSVSGPAHPSTVGSSLLCTLRC